MLISMKLILQRAREGGYGVPAPNVRNEDTVRACIEAAEELNSPLIIGPGYKSNPDFKFFACMIRELAEQSKIEIAFNLDHGSSPEQCFDAADNGYTGVMIDASVQPYEQNAVITKQVVDYAHARGVSVEAELGHVGQGIQYEVDRDAALTDPDEAVRFVSETGVDALAVAIGSAHGVYKGVPRLDFDRLQVLRRRVSVPLVLHGGSGTGDENLARACREGICKVNLATDLYNCGGRRVAAFIGEGGSGLQAYQELTAGYKDELKRYMQVIGAAGRA
ncbi:MAG: class II fructose-bisphosphate aldolase [Clostridia bacterium]|nr:class II fructose-bisphosphate aldolase [Clostridia bacterium]